MSPAFCDALASVGRGFLAAILLAAWAVGAGCSGGAGAGAAAGAAGTAGGGMDRGAGRAPGNARPPAGGGQARGGALVRGLEEAWKGRPGHTASIRRQGEQPR